MARRKAAPGDAVSLASLGLESYQMVELNRADLKKAPYNPRVMTDSEKRKLRAGLKRHGLVAPVTWNKRTGNIVGGHQRLDQLDALVGHPNYQLKVAMIDVDESREKELNLLLNNPGAQGDWELPALRKIFEDKEVNLEGAGFDRSDLFHIFGADVFDDESEDKLNELAQKVREFSQLYAKIEARNSDREREDFYIVLVFRDAGDRTQFCLAAGWPDNRYQSADDLRQLTGIKREDMAKSA